MIETKFETITPDIAKEYLKSNRKNRKVKKSTVDTYANDMKRGVFITTHQGIAFDENGELLDGQHRLLAIIKSDTPIQIMVTRGIPTSACTAVDRGVTRSVRDVLCMELHNDNSENSGMFTNTKLLSSLSMLVECNMPLKRKLSVEDIKRLSSEFGEVLPAIYTQVVTKAGSKARAPMISASIAASSCGVEAETLNKFFSIFFKDDIAGCEDYNINAVLNWKRQIDSAKLSKVTINSRRLYLGTQNAIYHFSNNTNVKRVVAPSRAVYNVESKVKNALSVV